MDLAEECGFTEGAIKQIESYRRFPNPDTLEAIAGAFNVKPEDLLNDPDKDKDDLAQKVYEKIKSVMAGPVPEHLTKTLELLKRLDPKKNKDRLILAQFESMVEGYLLGAQGSDKKKST